MPLELETEAQELFEISLGGFGRGFESRTFTSKTFSPLSAGQAGAGASMAFRRDLLLRMQLFAAELDAGTPTQSGGDTYAFYRVLSAGYTLNYSPSALAWHRHRREISALVSTLRGYTIGTYVYLLRCWLLHGELRAVQVAFSWWRNYLLRNLWRGLRQCPDAPPLAFTLSEWSGLCYAPYAYFRSRRNERLNR
jgi:hypothetical protein